MFTVKAGFTDDIEVRSGIDQVREFFSDMKNFVDLMPGIEQIYTDAKGIAHWKIQAEVPFVGQMLQKFAVELAEDTPERIEWSPVRTEAENFLRYSAEFIEKAKNVTIVHFSQMVELRRKSGRELHYLAGMAGESLISKELTKGVSQMIKIFIDRAKEKLER
jgi:carbon monoxide dehydrogenase subunit G